MKNIQKIMVGGGIAVIVIIAAWLIWPDGRSGEGVMTVTSDDGLAELSIPPGALPADVAIGDIGVVPATEADLRAELGLEDLAEGEESTLLAYDLLPDGIEFRVPVTVTITHETNEGGVIPALFHVADGEFELIADTEVSIDAETGRTSVSGDISHFSYVGSDIDTLYQEGGGMFNYELTSGGQGEVGDTFPYHLTITPNQNFSWFKSGGGPDKLWGYNYRMAPMTTWKVRGFNVMTRHDGVIEPMTLSSNGGDFKGSESFVLEGEHTCIEDGENSLFIPPPDSYIKIEYRMEKEFRRGKSYRNATTRIYIEGGRFVCEELEGGWVRVQVPPMCIDEATGTQVPCD
ncbi:hypothetical protein AMJ57_00230 [Parcubacteria bacterium SG8_24]|nr:MAG: hypothetical protein AMJ57_00230 [Parcubacteria bacterium SG8_24]